MSVTTMADRRKATTYGKASRIPGIATGNSFAKATQGDSWDLEHDVLSWKEHAAPMLANPVNASNNYTGVDRSRRNTKASTLEGLQKGKLDKLIKHSISSVSAANHAAEDKNLFDVPSSEDDYQQGTNERSAPFRKRRRISPVSVKENCSFVYDDVSLQRHIAAESQNDLSRTSSYSGDARLGDALASRDIQKMRMLSPCQEVRGPMKWRTTREQKVREHRVNIGGNASREPKAGSYTQNVAPIAMGSTQKVGTSITVASEDAPRPTTPKINLPIPLSKMVDGKPKGPLSSDGKLNTFVTPIRSVKSAEGSATPRQRELWDKLLLENTSDASTSSIDLPGLILTEKRNTNAKRQTAPLRVLSGSTGEDPLKSRRRKIVDTLHPDNYDLRHEDNYVQEGTGSSSIRALSETVETEASDVNCASTIQTSPSAESQNKLKLLDIRSLSNVSYPESSSIVAGPKVTYARQRSYLTDSDLDGLAVLDIPVATEPINTDVSCYRAVGERLHRNQSKKGLENQCWDSQDSQGGAMRSIHELREAGGNVRLISELEAVLDDVEEEQPPSGTLRRARLLDLVTKLQEPSSSRLFIDHGLESRLLALVGVDTDLITNSLLVTAILQLIACPSSASVLPQLRDSRIVDFLIDLLGLDHNLAAQAKLRDFNLSKCAQQEYTSMCNFVLKSAVWTVGSPSVLSCHVLALQCLEHIVRQTRESGSLSQVLSAYAIRRIVATSVPPPSVPSLHYATMSAIQLELAVSILESSTISDAGECQESLWEGETLERIIGLLPLLYSWEEGKCATSRTLTLRLYVNLTNNTPSICEELSKPEIIEIMCKMITIYFEPLSSHANKLQQPISLDDLILTLGALVNLAESSDVSRQLVMDLHCDGRSYLAVLWQLFTTNSQSAAEVYSEEETNLNVAFGYLSVLLGSLCLNNKIRAWIRNRVQDGSLKQLVDALEEFLQYYRKAGQGAPRETEDAVGDYVGRLQTLVEDLKC